MTSDPWNKIQTMFDWLYQDKCSDSFEFYLKNEKNVSLSLSSQEKIVLYPLSERKDLKRLKKSENNERE